MKIELIDKWIRCANYLSACQLYLRDNPLLKRELSFSDVKKKIVGHWGTVPGQNFIYAHLNRIICDYGLNMIYVSGPGHGGNAMVANSFIEGTYNEIYPNVDLQRLFKQFSFPGGISSHVAPEVPGSINEGGELGYSLAHSFGAVLDNPSLIAACVVGDGEAETGPLATSWRLNKFLNPKTDGTVLPILHLNGYKIANPTVLARISEKELISYFKGLGYNPKIVKGETDLELHKAMYKALDECVLEIKLIKKLAEEKNYVNYVYPMIILKSPKGWTGPSEVKGQKIVGTFRAHQVPLVVENESDLKALSSWLKSYHPEELFDLNGNIKSEIKKLSPIGDKRMSANPNANGGLLLKELIKPDFKKYAVDVNIPGNTESSDMMELGNYVRDLIKLNKTNFRVFGPDEALSNRLNHIFEVDKRSWNSFYNKDDEYLSSSGRVMDGYLSEHFCEGALEGYLLTGRHGFFHSYEAFIRIVDSMASQHAKWLKTCSHLPWRKDIASLNYVLTSHVWQQDHNGYTHQDPGFLNHLATKKADTVRMYLPFDTNTLLSCFDHIISTKNYINVIVASKHLRPQWLSMDKAIEHCTKGVGVLDFVTNEIDNPDIVLACAGDTPTLEVIAASCILRKFLNIKIKVINVVDLMKLSSNHPHSLSDEEYDNLFTLDKQIVFAFHGYPNLIHELTYKRHNQNMHVRGYIEEGTITTPFDMRVQNNIDRYHLVIDVIKYLGKTDDLEYSALLSYCYNKLIEHKVTINELGVDMPDVKDFKFSEEKKKFIC